MVSIDKQAAIDICNSAIDFWRGQLGEGIVIAVRKKIEQLPSVQPGIIHCKDCVHIQKWRSEESAKKFEQIYECARNVFDCPKPEDFCSKAERRTDD